MKLNLKLSAPIFTEIELSSNCQLNCSYCNAAPLSGDEIGVNDVLKIVDQLHDLGIYMFSISGGEPTLHPDIIEIISYSVRKIPAVLMSTNGIRLADVDFAKDVNKAAPKLLVGISLDSTDIETNNYHRGTGGAEATKAIENCSKLGQPMCISTVLTDQNIDNALLLIGRFYPQVKSFRFFPRVRCNPNETHLDSETYRQRVQTFSKLLRELDESNPDISVVLPFRTVTKENRGAIFDEVDSCCCPFTKLFINARLEAYPCWYSANPINLMGMVGTTNIKDIWHSKEAEQLRERARTECLCGNPLNSNNVPIRYHQHQLT